MFVYNVKFNKKTLIKIVFILIIILVALYFFISAFKLYKDTFKVKDSNTATISYIEPSNYTNILKSVNENLDSYIGKEICFTGYIYRLSDFKNSEFVLARDMIVNSKNETLIVGFLCDYKNAIEFKDNTWIEITGRIEQGNYHGDIPIIKITNIKEISKPEENVYVYPPDNSYVTTVNML